MNIYNEFTHTYVAFYIHMSVLLLDSKYHFPYYFDANFMSAFLET